MTTNTSDRGRRGSGGAGSAPSFLQRAVGSLQQGVRDAADSLQTKAGGVRENVSGFNVRESVGRGLNFMTAPCKTLREHVLLDGKDPSRASRAGPMLKWSVLKARTKRGAACSVWVLDKQSALAEVPSHEHDAVLQLHRAGVSALARLRHPCVLRVLEPLEETKALMCFVTEPVAASLSDVMHRRTDDEGAALSELDVKHGMKQVAEGVAFLTHKSQLTVRGLGPESCCIAEQDGRWCICFLGWARSCSSHAEVCSGGTVGGSIRDATANASTSGPSSGTHGAHTNVLLPLGFVAPEVARESIVDAGAHAAAASAAGPAADVFSVGALAYAMLMGSSPLGRPADASEHQTRMAQVPGMNVAGMQAAAVACIRPCLAPFETMRPSLSAFVESDWFRSDRCLSALIFLESIVEKPDAQRVAVVRELPSLLPSFDRNVLSKRVLPPLLGELRNESMAIEILPIVISIAKMQTAEEFASSALPFLLPRIQGKTGSGELHDRGEVQTLLLEHAADFSRLLPPDLTAGPLVDMLVRGLRAGGAGSSVHQSLALKRIPEVSERLEYAAIKSRLLPPITQLMMDTSHAGVRVASMHCLGRLVHNCGVDDCVALMKCVARVTAVDASPGTIMASVGMATAVADAGGVDVVARAVLPVLCPLLVSRSLSSEQFRSFLASLRALLDSIQEKKEGPVGAREASTAADARGGSDDPLDPRNINLRQAHQEASHAVPANGAVNDFGMLYYAGVASTSGASPSPFGGTSGTAAPLGSLYTATSAAVNPPSLAAPAAVNNQHLSGIEGQPPGAHAQPGGASKSAADQLSDFLSGPDPNLFSSLSVTPCTQQYNDVGGSGSLI